MHAVTVVSLIGDRTVLRGRVSYLNGHTITISFVDDTGQRQSGLKA